MKRLLAALGAIVAAVLVAAPSGNAHAQGKSLTLCWAAWDPANALVELSKDFTTRSGVNMKFEFVPWPNFADRMLNELNSKGKLCDLMIGDSQYWRRRRERPLRQAERVLRPRRHQDRRLHAGDRCRLCLVAQGDSELLGAAGNGRRARLDLSQGLVRPAGTSDGV